jgi:hypothetical protein
VAAISSRGRMTFSKGLPAVRCHLRGLDAGHQVIGPSRYTGSQVAGKPGRRAVVAEGAPRVLMRQNFTVLDGSSAAPSFFASSVLRGRA